MSARPNIGDTGVQLPWQQNRRPRNGGTATQLPLFTAESHDALSS